MNSMWYLHIMHVEFPLYITGAKMTVWGAADVPTPDKVRLEISIFFYFLTVPQTGGKLSQTLVSQDTCEMAGSIYAKTKRPKTSVTGR